jgi:hypothetical protein
MSVRKRTWKNAKGETKEAWVVWYCDQNGKPHIKTFGRKKEGCLSCHREGRSAPGHSYA